MHGTEPIGTLSSVSAIGNTRCAAPSYRTVDNSLCAANVLDQRWEVYKVFFSP